MASAVCKNCGKTTNSTTSNMWFTKNWIPTECYASWDFKKEKWVKGCSYNKANKFNREFADGLIK